MTNEERDALISQGWTPPKVISLDEKWAHACTKELFDPLETVDVYRAYDYFLEAIKKGRELERAEAKPGMVWVKHDYSSVPPRLGPGANVATICDGGHFNATSVGAIRDWTTIEYYMWIEWPEDYEQ